MSTNERRDFPGTYIDERLQSAAVTANNVQQLIEGQGCQQTVANIQLVQSLAAPQAAPAPVAPAPSESSGGQEE